MLSAPEITSLMKRYHIRPERAKQVLDYMKERKMLVPETVTRAGRKRTYWVSATADAADRIIEVLEREPLNKRAIVAEIPYTWRQVNRALERLTRAGTIVETVTRCPTVPMAGVSEKPMKVYSLDIPSREEIGEIRERIREQMVESEDIYGEIVEEWLREEFPGARIEKEWQIPGLGPENKFDFFVITPEGTRIGVEMKGWRREPVSEGAARISQFKWKLDAADADKGLFFAPYAETGLYETFEELGIRYVPLKFPEEEE